MKKSMIALVMLAKIQLTYGEPIALSKIPQSEFLQFVATSNNQNYFNNPPIDYESPLNSIVAVVHNKHTGETVWYQVFNANDAQMLIHEYAHVDIQITWFNLNARKIRQKMHA